VVVLPETALPAFFDQLPEDYLASIRDHARATGKDILMGIVEREPRAGEYDYYNTLLRLTGPRQAYRKRHLVPFGEYIPPGFKFVLAVLKIPLSDFASGGRGQPPIEAGGMSFGVAICYEDIFGEEAIDALPRAQALVNVSNDAWFGESFAAEQHLQASQARALETSRWMVRATNTGATAAIDEKGRVAGRLAPFTVGTLTADVTPRKGQTPYVLFGNLLAVVMGAALAGIAWSIGRRGEPPR
jgi:apolipoprotein N-acyltransferase